MSCLNRLFSMKELELLDEKQLALLDDAISVQIRTSPAIDKILREKVEPLYNRFVGKGKPRGKRAGTKRR